MADMQMEFIRVGRNAYRMEEVDEYVAISRQKIAALEAEKASLESKMIVLANKVEEYRADEDSLRAALLGAQRFGDNIVKEAKQKAEALANESKQQAAAMENEAKARAEAAINSVRDDVAREKLEYARLQRESARFREQLKRLYAAQLSAVEKLPGEDDTKTAPASQDLPDVDAQELTDSALMTKADTVGAGEDSLKADDHPATEEQACPDCAD